MSARLVTPTSLRRPSAAVAALAACALAAGVACAQPGPPAPPADDADKLDTRNPVPADAPRRKSYEKLQVPGRDRDIFAGIEDFSPVAAESQNRREYDAWVTVVQHAKNQSAAELNEYAVRDLVPLDLAKMARAAYRLELLRFDGKLTGVRRLVAPPALRDSGVAELYEARLVPLDESPLTPVSLVFVELPESLAAVRAKPPEEWMDAESWVTASGYYFKTMTVPGPQAGSTVQVPVLVGKGLTPLPGPPAGSPTPAALDKGLRIYKFIQDDTKMTRNRPTEAGWPEVAAFNRVVLHASRFPAAELERDATTDLGFADLFGDARAAHRLALVRLEGRLVSLRRLDSNDWLTAAGVGALYEGWLIPDGERGGHPVCAVFTEPVEGVEPARRVNKWVSFAGFSFKRLRYESGEEDAKTPGKNVDKLAPLLIGRGAVSRLDPDRPSVVSWSAFADAALFGAGLLVVTAGLFTLWYRRGDRQVRAEAEAARARNPFDPPA